MKTSTHKTLIALAAGLLTLGALPASAADQQRQTPDTRQQERDRKDDRGQGNANGRGQDSRYGSWNASWGARPAAPPRSFTRTGDWYRHVRACQQRYRTYNASTDRYVVRRGQTAVCRL